MLAVQNWLANVSAFQHSTMIGSNYFRVVFFLCYWSEVTSYILLAKGEESNREIARLAVLFTVVMTLAASRGLYFLKLYIKHFSPYLTELFCLFTEDSTIVYCLSKADV